MLVLTASTQIHELPSLSNPFWDSKSGHLLKKPNGIPFFWAPIREASDAFPEHYGSGASLLAICRMRLSSNSGGYLSASTKNASKYFLESSGLSSGTFCKYEPARSNGRL